MLSAGSFKQSKLTRALYKDICFGFFFLTLFLLTMVSGKASKEKALIKKGREIQISENFKSKCL